MHKVCDYNFQIHRRNGQRAILRKEMAIFGGIPLGELAQKINFVLSNIVVYPNLVNKFSLLGIEHQNGITCGWSETHINIPGTILRFHFILDRNLLALGHKKFGLRFGTSIVKEDSGTNLVSTSLIRQHVAISKIHPKIGGGTILTIAFNAVELGDIYQYLGRTVNSMFLLYSILGMTTKAYKMYGGIRLNMSDHVGTVLSTNSPKDYHKCYSIWRRFPNLLPKIDLDSAEYILEHIQSKRNLIDSGNKILNSKQRIELGISPVSIPSGDSGLIHWIYESIYHTLFVENYNDTRRNRCLEICFTNFNTSAKSVFELATMLWSIDKAIVIRKIHTIIWSKK